MSLNAMYTEEKEEEGRKKVLMKNAIWLGLT